jgi:hypothetical protein
MILAPLVIRDEVFQHSNFAAAIDEEVGVSLARLHRRRPYILEESIGRPLAEDLNAPRINTCLC